MSYTDIPNVTNFMTTCDKQKISDIRMCIEINNKFTTALIISPNTVCDVLEDQQKSLIRETLNLSTDADSINIAMKRKKMGGSKYFLLAVIISF